MKITFKNLGNLRHAEVDLKPLTVIIGPNNSSKTYMAYSIYGLAKKITGAHGTWSEYPPGVLDDDGSIEITNPSINDLTANLSLEFIDEIDRYFQNTNSALFQQFSIELELEATEFLKNSASVLGDSGTPRTDATRIRLEQNRLYIEPCPEYRDEIPEIWAFILLPRLLSRTLLYPTEHVIFFPAERNTFVTTYRILSNRRFKNLRDSRREMRFRGSNPESRARQMLLFEEQGDISYPQPIEDFLDFLSDLELERDTSDDQFNADFVQLATNIEARMQGGHSINFRKTKLGGQEIKVKIRDGLDIDLYNASSSIKQLAPFLLYLRHRARKGDFILIDEPEMNLHPENQAKFMEVLAILVNLGVRVLITTHSPYFMQHLNVLVAAGNTCGDVRAKQSESLYMQDERAFLRMDQVSAYEVKGDTLLDLKDPDYGIRWDTLGDVSADIQQKLFEVLELSHPGGGDES